MRVPQTERLADALKRTLEAHRKTYQDVAAARGLSEPGVKRLFAGHNLPPL